jgi:hypothetical protein
MTIVVSAEYTHLTASSIALRQLTAHITKTVA